MALDGERSDFGEVVISRASEVWARDDRAPRRCSGGDVKQFQYLWWRGPLQPGTSPAV